jgi:hypothetical protein
MTATDPTATWCSTASAASAPSRWRRQTTAANTWTIEHRSKGSAPVYDSAGVAVAEIAASECSATT